MPATKRAEAKRMAAEAAAVADVGMKIANDALDKLRDANEKVARSLHEADASTAQPPGRRRGVKKRRAGHEARPTASSANRAAETTAELDVKVAARKRAEETRRRILGHAANKNNRRPAKPKPAMRHPRPPSAPATSLATSSFHVRCDACLDGKILRDAELAWAAEKVMMSRELALQVKRNNELAQRLRVAENVRGADADDLLRTKRALLDANAQAKKVEARFNAQESRHRQEQQRAAAATAAAEERAAAAEVERDDAVTTLQHALRRMETFEARANANFAMARDVEDSVRRMESAHAAALDEAAAARERADDLEAEKEHAGWTTDILTKMSELQLSQYRNKRNMLLAALDAKGDGGLHEAIYGPGGGAGGEANPGLATHQSSITNSGE